MMTCIEAIARAICQSNGSDADIEVEWGQPMIGPRNSRVVLHRDRCPAWHLFLNDASAAILAYDYWLTTRMG